MRLFTRVLLVLGPTLVLVGCASIAPPQPPSLHLPQPPSDLRATRKGDKVNLVWTVPVRTTDRQTIRKPGLTHICRGSEAHLADCGTPVGSAPQQAQGSSSKPVSTSYSDSLPASIPSENPDGFVTYAVEALNVEGRGAGLSNQVRVPTMRTLPPPQDFRAQVTGQGVVLSWIAPEVPNNSPQAAHYLVRVFRREDGKHESTSIGSVPVTGDPTLTLTDSNIEWQKTYEYRAETVTVIAESGKPEVQVEGDDTPEIKVFANDVFPPAVPMGLQAVFSGPGQQPFIDLVWAPVPDVDLDGYNIYRREAGSASEKINTQLAKVPAYRDTQVAAGKTYFYSVSALDVRGNESTRSEEASERVP